MQNERYLPDLYSDNIKKMLSSKTPDITWHAEDGLNR